MGAYNTSLERYFQNFSSDIFLFEQEGRVDATPRLKPDDEGGGPMIPAPLSVQLPFRSCPSFDCCPAVTNRTPLHPFNLLEERGPFYTFRLPSGGDETTNERPWHPCAGSAELPCYCCFYGPDPRYCKLRAALCLVQAGPIPLRPIAWNFSLIWVGLHITIRLEQGSIFPYVEVLGPRS